MSSADPEQMVRKTRWLFPAAVALGILVATCKRGGGALPVDYSVPTQVASTPAEIVTIRFAVWDQERIEGLYESAIEAFETAYPTLRVALVSIEETLGITDRCSNPQIGGEGTITCNESQPEDREQRLCTAADVISMLAYGSVPPRGLARDLTPFIEADPGFEPDDLWPNTLEFYKYNGGMWAVPLRVSPAVLLFYDRDIFDAAGVPYPQPGWTWEEFLATARALTVREGDTVTRWGFVQGWGPDPSAFVESQAGSLLDFSADPPRPRFSRPEVIEAMRRYIDLFTVEQVAPPHFDQETTDRLIEGRQAAMWIEPLFMWRGRSAEHNIGLAPLPGVTPDAPTTRLMPVGVYMSAGTVHPDAAWRWMSFLSRQLIPERTFLTGVPARRSVAEGSGFWQTLDEGVAGALQHALAHSYPTRPWLTGESREQRSPGIATVFSEAIEAILDGEESVEEAMLEAQARTEAVVEMTTAHLTQAAPVPICNAGTPKRPSSEEVTTITFVPTAVASSLLQRYRDLAASFHEQHPDIAVRIEPAGFADRLRELASGADCFAWSEGSWDLEELAAVLGLEPLMKADPYYRLDDLYPAALEAFTWQGTLYGLPAELVPYVVEYHKPLFDAANVAYPTSNWTYDDFLARSLALTRGEGANRQYGFVPEPYPDYALPLILEHLGADLLDETQSPPALSLDSPATVAALRRYGDLATVHHVQPTFAVDPAAPGGEALAGWQGLIREARAAMWMIPASWSAHVRPREGDVGVVPLPGVGVGGGGYVRARGYFISAQSRAPQACWEWLKFLSAQPEAAEGLPARRSVAESEAYRRLVGLERAEAYRAAVANTDPHSFIVTAARQPWLRGVEYWLFRAYLRVVNGEAGVEAALGEAQGLADEYRACVIAREGFFDREKWEGCLREVDPTLPDHLFTPAD